MMMNDESNIWFVKWDEELPSPDELISLSQSLITPNLAMAFDIQNTTTTTTHRLLQQPPPPPPPLQDTRNSSGHEFELFESGGTGGGGGGGRGSDRGGAGSEEHVKNLKRPRLVWTPQLHKRFVEVVAHLGIKNAVPKTIMQMMSVDGLTRENVASHLQKYRLYLKRMQKGVSNGGSRGFVTDTDHLFASSPVPAHFLHPGRPSSDQFLPSVPVTTMSHHHQMVAAVALGNHQHNHNLRHFGTSTSYGQFNHPFLSTQLQSHVMTSYLKDTGPAKPTTNVQKALTLFPSGND